MMRKKTPYVQVKQENASKIKTQSKTLLSSYNIYTNTRAY